MSLCFRWGFRLMLARVVLRTLSQSNRCFFKISQSDADFEALIWKPALAKSPLYWPRICKNFKLTVEYTVIYSIILYFSSLQVGLTLTSLFFCCCLNSSFQRTYCCFFLYFSIFLINKYYIFLWFKTLLEHEYSCIWFHSLIFSFIHYN